MSEPDDEDELPIAVLRGGAHENLLLDFGPVYRQAMFDLDDEAGMLQDEFGVRLILAERDSANMPALPEDFDFEDFA